MLRAVQRSNTQLYDQSARIGQKAVDLAIPILRNYGTAVDMKQSGCPIVEKIQLLGGDMLFVPGGTETIHFIEVKASEKVYDSMFIETVSNPWTRRPGWIFNIRSGYVWYHYLPNKTTYLMDAPALQRWTDDNEQFYQEIPNRYNDSLGIVVPWVTLSCDLAENEFTFIDHKLSDFESKLDQVGLLN